MVKPRARITDCNIVSITPMQSTDGSPSNWVSIKYVEKDKSLTTKGCKPTVNK